MTRTILCFGDSNTWGYNPADGNRFPADVRWPGVLQQELGPSFKIIEEGLNGRTTVFDDPKGAGRKGRDYLFPCLQSHRPIDAVILALGINDLKNQFNASASQIAGGLASLIEIIQSSGAGPGGEQPRLLVLAPPIVGTLSPYYAEMFAGTVEKSRQLHQAIAALAGPKFLDTSSFLRTSELDGIHLDAAMHRSLGLAVASAFTSENICMELNPANQ